MNVCIPFESLANLEICLKLCLYCDFGASFKYSRKSLVILQTKLFFSVNKISQPEGTVARMAFSRLYDANTNQTLCTFIQV